MRATAMPALLLVALSGSLEAQDSTDDHIRTFVGFSAGRLRVDSWTGYGLGIHVDHLSRSRLGVEFSIFGTASDGAAVFFPSLGPAVAIPVGFSKLILQGGVGAPVFIGTAVGAIGGAQAGASWIGPTNAGVRPRINEAAQLYRIGDARHPPALYVGFGLSSSGRARGKG